ncbi:MAG: response regulator [Pseudomonadota bacterium]
MAGPTHTVLVIEDDTDVRNALAELLSGEGYAVSLTADGGEALDKLRAGLRPSVILLDLMMPNVDGWDFRRAQLDDPSLAAIPVILLTASGFRPDSMRSEQGRLEMLPKPVQAHVLLDTLERMAFRERPARI